MNQVCKVCGEAAAGFHFGAFTCEGCKSFFGRSYNNLNSISECKNNGECVINKKNRTACKGCRLRKCLLVGMSKNGSRFGRRSNWFKIHCLLQEQQHKAMKNPTQTEYSTDKLEDQRIPPLHPELGRFNFLGPQQFASSFMHLPRTKEEMMFFGLDEYKPSASPSVSSSESHNSDTSVEVSEARRSLQLIPGLIPPAFLHTPNFLFPPGYSFLYSGLLQSTINNNNFIPNQNFEKELFTKQDHYDSMLHLQKLDNSNIEKDNITSTLPFVPETSTISSQDEPIDLSLKSTQSCRSSSPANSEISTKSIDVQSSSDEEDEYRED